MKSTKYALGPILMIFLVLGVATSGYGDSPRLTMTLEDVKKLMEEERRKTPQIGQWEADLEEEALEAEAP